MTEDRAMRMAYALCCSRRDRAEALVAELQAENARMKGRLRILEILEEESANRWGLGHSMRVVHEVTE